MGMRHAGALRIPTGAHLVQVDLIMMGERYRKMLERGADPLQQAQADRSASYFENTVSKPVCAWHACHLQHDHGKSHW